MAGARVDGELLSKAGAAKLLGVSTRRILQLREQGKLSSTRDVNGVHLYERSSIIRLAVERANSADPRIHRKGVPTILASKVFELFDRGCTLPQVVQETQQPPDVVRALFVEYSTPLGQTPKPPAPPADDEARHDRVMSAFAREQDRRDRRRQSSRPPAEEETAR